MSTKQRVLKPPFWRSRTVGSGFLQTTTMGVSSGVSAGAPFSTSYPYNWPEAIGATGVMTDKVTPGYKTLRSQGTVINNGMSKAEERRTPFLGSAHWYSGVLFNGDFYHWTVDDDISTWFYHYDTNPALHASIGDPIISVSKHHQLATIDVLGKIQAPETLSLVTLAEAGKTIEMVARTAKLLSEGYRVARRRGSIGEARRALKRYFKRAPTPTGMPSGPAKSWLEWRYGWMPLLFDVESTLQAFAKGEFTKPRYTARGKSKANEKSTTTYSDVHANGNVYYGSYTVDVVATESVDVRAYVMYDAELIIQRFADFGVLSLPETLWELLPYSFVVDWFIPVGDWLRALTPKLGVNILSEGITTTHERKSERKVTSWSPGPPFFGNTFTEVASCVGMVDVLSVKTKSRSPALPTLTLPPIDVKINVKRALDAISLLTTASGVRSPHVRI